MDGDPSSPSYKSHDLLSRHGLTASGEAEHHVAHPPDSYSLGTTPGLILELSEDRRFSLLGLLLRNQLAQNMFHRGRAVPQGEEHGLTIVEI